MVRVNSPCIIASSSSYRHHHYAFGIICVDNGSAAKSTATIVTVMLSCKLMRINMNQFNLKHEPKLTLVCECTVYIQFRVSQQ